MTKVFILYDERGNIDTDEAAVLDTAEDEEEVKESNRLHDTGVWYEYDVAADGKTLTNGNIREDLSPGRSPRKGRPGRQPRQGRPDRGRRSDRGS